MQRTKRISLLPLNPLLGLVIGLLVLTNCQNLQSVYNEQAYQQAVTLKVESLALMDHANEPFSNYADDVAELKVELEKAHQYSVGRPKNEESKRQWRLLMDPDRNLLGGFLKRWEQESTLSPTFIDEAKKLVSDAFTTIIELESGKRKS